MLLYFIRINNNVLIYYCRLLSKLQYCNSNLNNNFVIIGKDLNCVLCPELYCSSARSVTLSNIARQTIPLTISSNNMEFLIPGDFLSQLGEHSLSSHLFIIIFHDILLELSFPDQPVSLSMLPESYYSDRHGIYKIH